MTALVTIGIYTGSESTHAVIVVKRTISSSEPNATGAGSNMTKCNYWQLQYDQVASLSSFSSQNKNSTYFCNIHTTKYNIKFGCLPGLLKEKTRHISICGSDLYMLQVRKIKPRKLKRVSSTFLHNKKVE